MMDDVNDSAIVGELTVKLGATGIEIEEVSRKFWSGDPPISHINGKDLIVLVAKTKRLEATQLLMLPHMEKECYHCNH